VADGVFVLGMHRSGTSAATRLLGLLGLRMPVDDDLVRPDERNPTGYWESLSLVAYTNRVLWAVESDMRCPLALQPGWEADSRLDPLRAGAPAAVAAAFGGTAWVWKDPRNCLALAFWRSALDVSPSALLVHRNPLEIAISAERSRRPDGKIYTLALWERYLRQALVQAEGLPMLVTRYDDLVADPVGWSAQVQGFLADSGIAVGAVSEDEAREFVDPSARRSELTERDLLADEDVSDAQRALFAALERAVGRHSSFVSPSLQAETPTTEALFGERRRALSMTRELKSHFDEEQRGRWDARLRRSALLAPARALYARVRSG